MPGIRTDHQPGKRYDNAPGGCDGRRLGARSILIGRHRMCRHHFQRLDQS
jgi:hypothetical protein